jgi:hypothetical protein
MMPRVHFIVFIVLVAAGVPRGVRAAPPVPEPILEPLATGTGCVIQSDFGSGSHGNFEVVVLQGSQLLHYWHDNSNVNFAWHRAEVISSVATAIAPGCLIQSNLGSGSHGNFEIVVQEGPNLVHYFHDNSNVTLPWERGQTIATGVTGPGSIIQSNFGSTSHGNFEVVVEGERASVQVGAIVQGGAAIDQNLVHYFHDNSDVTLPWQRAQVVTFRGRSEKVCQLTGDFDKETLQPTTNETDLHYGVAAVDLGFPVESSDGLFFLFGDSRPFPDHNPFPERHPR